MTKLTSISTSFWLLWNVTASTNTNSLPWMNQLEWNGTNYNVGYKGAFHVTNAPLGTNAFRVRSFDEKTQKASAWTPMLVTNIAGPKALKVNPLP